MTEGAVRTLVVSEIFLMHDSFRMIVTFSQGSRTRHSKEVSRPLPFQLASWLMMKSSTAKPSLAGVFQLILPSIT